MRFGAHCAMHGAREIERFMEKPLLLSGQDPAGLSAMPTTRPRNTWTPFSGSCLFHVFLDCSHAGGLSGPVAKNLAGNRPLMMNGNWIGQHAKRRKARRPHRTTGQIRTAFARVVLAHSFFPGPTNGTRVDARSRTGNCGLTDQDRTPSRR